MKPSTEQLKQAIISVLIGVGVSLITQLAQTFVIWLQSFDANAIGSALAAARYATLSFRYHA